MQSVFPHHVGATGGALCCRHELGLTPVSCAMTPERLADVLSHKSNTILIKYDTDPRCYTCFVPGPPSWSGGSAPDTQELPLKAEKGTITVCVSRPKDKRDPQANERRASGNLPEIKSGGERWRLSPRWRTELAVSRWLTVTQHNLYDKTGVIVWKVATHPPFTTHRLTLADERNADVAFDLVLRKHGRGLGKV